MPPVKTHAGGITNSPSKIALSVKYLDVGASHGVDEVAEKSQGGETQA